MKQKSDFLYRLQVTFEILNDADCRRNCIFRKFNGGDFYGTLDKNGRIRNALERKVLSVDDGTQEFDVQLVLENQFVYKMLAFYEFRKFFLAGNFFSGVM